MEMNVNTQVLKNIRTEKNWTQQHLADACDVSLRTIQRIEKTGVASSESVAALSAVYEIKRETFVVQKQATIADEDITQKQGQNQAQNQQMPLADLSDLSEYRVAAVILVIAQIIGFGGIFYSSVTLTQAQFQLALTVVSLASLVSFLIIGVSAHRKGLLKKLLSLG